MDVDSITKGRDFGVVLTETLARCAVMLVIVGRHWLSIRDDTGRRKLDDPNDFVRLEIAAALKRNIPVIPVRIEGARMPKADELPDDLKPLAMRQAAIITHENFSGDMGGIERDLHLLLNSKFAFNRMLRVAIASLTAICLISFWLWWSGFMTEPELPEFAPFAPEQPWQKEAGVDYAKERERYEWAADKGDANAMFNLGFLYERGFGVAQDYAKAREWYEKAADKGDTGAMYGLGWLYRDGQGVAQNYPKAREWFQRAADRGNTGAMVRLGVLYRDGQGVAEDYLKARDWFQRAADNGDPDAMVNLGAVYFRGQGVAQNYTQAREWFQRAADKGNTNAMVNLGLLYANAWGVARDYTQARDWFQRAADKGDPRGNTYIKRYLR
jgi:TPR repeat protein